MVSGRRSSSGTASSLRPLPPVSCKAKDYTDRPEEVVDELDELRTRGIAKVLNKHFTTTARQLAIEKAEADSALADLERRRAQTKAFVASKSGELNPYDKLYVQLQQKRAECRRKEKETMMLYQRYVMKYGKSAKAAPLVSTPSTSKELQDGRKDDAFSVDLKGDPPGKSALGTLDENSEITFSKFYEIQRENQEKELRKKENEENTQHFMSALNKFMNDSEGDKEQTCSSPELILMKDNPSSMSSDGNDDPFMSAVSKFTSQVTQDDPMANNNYSIMTEHDEDIRIDPDTRTRIVIGSGFDPGISAVVTPEIKRTPSKDPPAVGVSDCLAEDESMVSQQHNQHNDDDISPPGTSDDKHAISTQVENVPATSDLLPEAAAVTLSPSSHVSTPKSKKVVRVDVNEEAAYFHTTTVEGYDIDDRSIISELTSANSAVTRQLMDEVETEMEDFIKFEMEAIRKMLDSEEDVSTVENSVKSDSSSLMLADQSVHVAMKAEAMALEMQKILDDFAKEDSSSVEGTKSLLDESLLSSEDKKEITDRTSVYPYKFEPSIPGEDWYVHFDDNYQKEYYVEKSSNRTQWDYPQKVTTSHIDEVVSSDDFLSDMHSVASSRRSLSRRSSRRALYRKQRKRRRARRLMISFVALLCVLATVFYWRVHHPDESMTGALSAFVVSIKAVSLKEVMSGIVDHFEYSLTDRKERETLIREQQEALARIERENRTREIADRRAMEEANRILMEAKAREEAKEQEPAQQQQLAKEHEIRPKDRKGPRHWGCNIPFAYVVPHCWRLAKTNPIFGMNNESDLTCLQ